ncbi:hypothetical protein FB446DRAFT_341226 [Lentinula raphanica]|nr:hypothetical protein FB446DRAFT_341226 [Lentinula raphanica]
MHSSAVIKFVLLGLCLSMPSTWATPVPNVWQKSSHSSDSHVPAESCLRAGQISDVLSLRDEVIVNEALDQLIELVPSCITRAPSVEGHVRGDYVISNLHDANGEQLGEIRIRRSAVAAEIEFEYYVLDEEKGISNCVLSIGHPHDNKIFMGDVVLRVIDRPRSMEPKVNLYAGIKKKGTKHQRGQRRS